MGSGDKRLAKAEEAIKRNNADYAIQILQATLKADPLNEEGNALYLEALHKKYASTKTPKTKGTMKLQVFQKVKKWENLAEGVRQNLVKDPANPKLFELIGNALIKMGGPGAAIPYLKRWTELDPKSATAWFWLSWSQKEIGDIEAAMDTAQRAFQLDKISKEINDHYRNISAAHVVASTKMDEAKELKDIVADKDAMKKVAAEARGMTEAEKLEEIQLAGGIEGAFANKDIKKLRQIAVWYKELADYRNAHIAYKKVYELDSTASDDLDHAGDMAIKLFEKQIRAAKEKGDKPKLAELVQKMNDFKEQDFHRRVEAHPTDLNLHYQYGQALYANKKFKQAAMSLQKAIKDPKIQDKVAGTLTKCFLEIGQYDLALRTADQAIEAARKEETRHEVLYLKGKALLGKDRREEAKEVFMEIMSENFDFKDVSKIINEQLSDV